MKPRARDSKGRFTRVAKAPPIDAALVRSLGADRRPFALTIDEEWVLAILDKRKWRDALNGKRPADHESG
jgi:hypothetical protein